MSAVFITYVWHYLAARAIYDELLRPITRGHPTSLLLLVLIAAAAYLVGRRSALKRR